MNSKYNMHLVQMHLLFPKPGIGWGGVGASAFPVLMGAMSQHHVQKTTIKQNNLKFRLSGNPN